MVSVATLFAYGDNSNTKTLIIFSANWCKYCHIAKNDMNQDKELSKTIKQYEIIEIDYDKDIEIVEGYGIKSIPAFIVIENRKELKRQIGYNGPKQLNDFLK
jgi:thioredoxin-related protein